MGYCDWAGASAAMRRYHDLEWGVPVRCERTMFEHLMLECLQCGLSWSLVLERREVFRACFAQFDYEVVADFDEDDVIRILGTEGMIRSPRKVRAIINNARRAREVAREFGSLCTYFWSFTKGSVVLFEGREEGQVPASNALSAHVAADLKRRGFSYVGPVNVYAHLQATGIVCDHDTTCPCRERIIESWPCVVWTDDQDLP